ncbi:adenine phosphoribosyltransferase [Parasphingopyxis lamellibrachiae]|uniref:Adenine phosphoribosyltransferase n=1 Tax=Parasphingopyxis lamellibrachiae TaxID=680125 RepID=A0A3D9FBQ2_9SPHN|nr:adenine phosphoribosyltransferase [Parasphingopyxis lamellibrachiae]RED15244.1 adenine phosphoribosyltransferase [Parasphingopyxis lamellibrachiae]
MSGGAERNADLKALIRTIPDFPKPGIQFRDITTLLLDPGGFATVVERMAAMVDGPIDAIAGVEARGFIFGAALARELGSGLVLVRKRGKLPGKTLTEDYALEYGSDSLEMHHDAIPQGARILLIDDLLATGGTAHAAVRLLRGAGASVGQSLFVIDLPDLGGAARLREAGVSVEALVEFEGD